MLCVLGSTEYRPSGSCLDGLDSVIRVEDCAAESEDWI